MISCSGKLRLYQNTPQQCAFSRQRFPFRCHSETWSGATPRATRANRVWLTVPSNRPDHLGYMLIMCSTGRERLEIQGCVAVVQIILDSPLKSSNKIFNSCPLWKENWHNTAQWNAPERTCERPRCGICGMWNRGTQQTSLRICHCVTNRECSIIDPVTHNPVWPVPFWIFQMSSHHNFTLLDVLYVSRRAHKLLSNDWKRFKRSPPPLTFRTDPLKEAHYRDQTRICDHCI